LIAFLPRAVEVFHPSRPLRGCARRDRGHGLSRRRRGRNGRGDRWRRVTHKRRGASLGRQRGLPATRRGGR
jgi:hypothetical protein